MTSKFSHNWFTSFCRINVFQFYTKLFIQLKEFDKSMLNSHTSPFCVFCRGIVLTLCPEVVRSGFVVRSGVVLFVIVPFLRLLFFGDMSVQYTVQHAHFMHAGCVAVHSIGKTTCWLIWLRLTQAFVNKCLC